MLSAAILPAVLVHVFASLSLTKIAQANCSEEGEAYPDSQPKACKPQCNSCLLLCLSCLDYIQHDTQ